MISDGAELLMLTPYSKLVGAVILPILGAVPDGAIVLFSGIGADAQTNLDVGVGALAGLDGHAHHHPLVPRDLRRPRRS